MSEELGNKNQRTDEEIIARAPRFVMLGGEMREIKPLVIARSVIWKKKLREKVDRYIADFNKEIDSLSMGEIIGIAQRFIFESIDDMLELICAYDPDAPHLQKQWLMEHATDEEVQGVFIEMVRLTFPFVRNFSGSLGALGGLMSLVEQVKTTKAPAPVKKQKQGKTAASGS